MKNLDFKYYKGSEKEYWYVSAGICSVCNTKAEYLCQDICTNCIREKKGPGIKWETEICVINKNGKLSDPCGYPPLKKAPKGWEDKINEMRFTPRYQTQQEFFHPTCCKDFMCFLGNYESANFDCKIESILPLTSENYDRAIQYLNEEFSIENNKLKPKKYDEIKHWETGKISLYPNVSGYYYFFKCNICNRVKFHNDFC